MKTTIRFFGMLVSFALLSAVSLQAQVSLTATVGTTSGSYTTMKDAFDAINLGTHKGVITITLSGSTTEPSSAVLNSSGGTSSYTSVAIYPTVSGCVISGTINGGPVLSLYGADNVTIDGRVNATGSAKDLEITNLSTSNTANTSTIRFWYDAIGNTVKYCVIKGSETYYQSGVIFFSTAWSSGNDNNTIDNNDITCSTDANRPLYAIYSFGTSSGVNDNISITNNNLYNFLNRGAVSTGILVYWYNTSWTISSNSFYETAAFTPTASANEYRAISIEGSQAQSSDLSFTITNNFIGGQSARCGGSAWTKSGASYANNFVGIYSAPYLIGSCSIQGNMIRNFNWTNASTNGWIGISHVQGMAEIGTLAGNTIRNITLTNSSPDFYFTGINYTSAYTTNIKNNVIDSLTIANSTSTQATNFRGIYIAGGSSNPTTVQNNTIGNAASANNISLTSAATSNNQFAYGIVTAASAGYVTISGNTIANITNSTTSGYGSVQGIMLGYGYCTVTNNTIKNLSIANTCVNSTTAPSVVGINYQSNTLVKIAGNSISSLSNTNSAFTGEVIGINIYSLQNTAQSASVLGNLIHSLSVNASTTAAKIYGVKSFTTYSNNEVICANNIITLGGNTATTIYGIGDVCSYATIQYNSVYISGSLGSGVTNPSYALYCATNGYTRNYRNNILFNARSTINGSNLHYAAYFSLTASSGLTLDYNDYFVSGTGGKIGYYNNVPLTTKPLITGFDASSITIDPNYATVGGTSAANYYPSATLPGVSVATVTNDYYETTRGASPKMGALESSSAATASVYISSTLQASYANLRAAFEKINDGTHQGSLIIKVSGSQSLTGSATLNASGTGSANYSSILIYPTASGLAITGNMNNPLIDLNGADNVTIDGRVNATGSTKSMTIMNSSTGMVETNCTIRFINDATGNTVQYCVIKGSAGNISSSLVATGVVLIGGTNGTTGNDNNTISNNDLTNAGEPNRPGALIYGYGGDATLTNSGITISNNNFYDFFQTASGLSGSCYGIFAGRASDAWTISGNSFYETTTLSPASGLPYYVIQIAPSNGSSFTGSGFTVSGNYFGGQAASCGGSALYKSASASNQLKVINIFSATTTVNSIQGNIIKNLIWYNNGNSNVDLISLGSGNYDVGTTSGNTFGATTGNGSIRYATTASGNFYAVNTASATTLNVQDNTVGAITLNCSSGTYVNNFFGYNLGATYGKVSGNTIGSTDASTDSSINSVNVATNSGGSSYGIISTITGTFSNNTVSKINFKSPGSSGQLVGIYISGPGTNYVTGNTVRDLTTDCNAPNADAASPLVGMVLTGGGRDTVTGNNIYNLSNTNAAFTGNVIGLYFSSSTYYSSLFSQNFIRSLSVSSSSTAAIIYGLFHKAGLATVRNNIISLTGNTRTTVYGMNYANGSASDNSNYYFNTVYLGGTLVSFATNPSYAFYFNLNGATVNIKDNIFYNARSTTSTILNYHCGLYLNINSGNLTNSYNNYYSPGTGGYTGYYYGVKKDASIYDSGGSTNTNPAFLGAGSTVAGGYRPTVTLNGSAVSGITTDYSGFTRPATPTMGAIEYTNPVLPVELTSFNVSTSKNGVTLNWKTATETNNYGFEIERTTITGHPEQANAPIYDPVGKGDWLKIGFVEGNGTTNAPKSYSFVDKSASGKTSYRLKQIDRDGKFEYSQTVEVTALSAPKEFGLEQNYPNPFNPTTAISYQLSANGFTTLKIYDAIGREVATLVNEVKEAGSYSAQFDGARFSSGVYFARLSSDGKSQMRKLLLMK